MLRCALAVAAVLAATPTFAQVARPFPVDALRGDLHITQAPEVLLNGKPARLAPGARLRDASGYLALPASLAGQKLRVHYTQEQDGLLKDVWVLNAAELANARWPETRAQAAQWVFDAATQTWSKP